MPESPTTPDLPPTAPDSPPRGRLALLQRQPWMTFLLPLVVFMVAGSLEPTPERPGGGAIGLDIAYAHYPIVYTLKIALTVAAVAFVLPGYRRFPFRVSPLSLAVGAVGVVAWVGLCQLNIERRVLGSLGIDWFADLGTRSGFNPVEELRANPAWAWGFLAVRFVGLAVVVPVIEEFFLRGWLMRFAADARWWEVPMGKATPLAIVLATAVPMLMHPAELLAAAAWFSMITAMYLRTRNVWDCVAAHAVTNLLLGVYVVLSGQWHPFSTDRSRGHVDMGFRHGHGTRPVSMGRRKSYFSLLPSIGPHPQPLSQRERGVITVPSLCAYDDCSYRWTMSLRMKCSTTPRFSASLAIL